MCRFGFHFNAVTNKNSDLLLDEFKIGKIDKTRRKYKVIPLALPREILQNQMPNP